MTRDAWRRVFAFTTAILFAVSWIFPIGAGLARDTNNFPRWWGPVDVTLAFVLALACFGIQTLVRGQVDKRAEKTTYRIYRASTHALIAVGVLVIVAGPRIAWVNCATGFLWRSWLGLYILPGWLAAARRNDVRRS